MEAKFENRCTLTQKRMANHLSAAIRWRGLWMYGAIWAVLVLMIVTDFVRGNAGTAVYELCLLALTLFLYFAVPKIQARLRHRKYHFVEFRDLVMTTRFYDDKMVCESEGEPAALEAPYKKLWALRPCGDMVIVLLRGKGEMLLDPAGFEKGNMKALAQFLQAKAPKAKIRFE